MSSKLSKGQVEALIPGQTLIIQCKSFREMQNAYQTAFKARKNMKLAISEMMITKSSPEWTVKIHRKEAEIHRHSQSLDGERNIATQQVKNTEA